MIFSIYTLVFGFFSKYTCIVNKDSIKYMVVKKGRKCIMKNFFKDGFDTLVKLLVTQLGMTIFGTMLVFTAYAVPNSLTRVEGKITKFGSTFLIVSLAAIALYLFILYTHIWEKGAKDRIKVDGARMEKQILKGLYLSLIANSINIILGIVMCCTYYLFDFDGSPTFLAYQIYGSANGLARMLQGMYTGLILYISPAADSVPPYLFLLITLPAIIITTLGYYRGFNNQRIFKHNKQ